MPKAVLEQIETLMKSGQGGEQLKFKPNELSSKDRLNVHEFAEHHGLKSRSEGVGAKRHLVLSLPTHYQREQSALGDGMRVVKNANNLDQLDKEEAKRAAGGKHQRRVSETKYLKAVYLYIMTLTQCISITIGKEAAGGSDPSSRVYSHFARSSSAPRNHCEGWNVQIGNGVKRACSRCSHEVRRSCARNLPEMGHSGGALCARCTSL